MSLEDKKKIFVPRITQLDAIEFDEEISNLLTNNFLEISRYLRPGALNNVKPEISLLIKLLVFRYSILRTNSSFGQQLLNVKYKDELSKIKAVLFALINYGLPYFKEKCDEPSFKLTNEAVKKNIDKLDLILKACHTINLLIFLRQGIYPTLVDRVLRIKYAPIQNLNRSVGYSYMTRELLWHGFMELLMYTLPLINYQALKRRFLTMISKKSNATKTEQHVVLNTRTTCVICRESPIMPCRISLHCPHVSCYYCIKSNILADEKFICPSCGETNTAHEHLQFLNS